MRGRIVLKHAGRLTLALLLGTIPAALGILTALLFSDPGGLLLGRLAGDELNSLLRGQFTIGRVGGTYLNSLLLEGVVIRDTAGTLLANVPQLEAHFRLPELLAGRIVFSSIRLEQPTIHLIQHNDGRFNFHDIFKLGEGPGGGEPSPLIELHLIRLHGATLELLLPWSPPDTVSTAASRVSSLAAERAKPGREIRETPEGLRRVIAFHDLNAKFNRLLISSPKNDPLTFDIDSLAAKVSDPGVTITELTASGWTRADTVSFTIEHAALPNTSATGQGYVTWPEGHTLYDFSLVSSKADLADLRWISPGLPSMTGHARVVAKSRSYSLTAFSLRGLEMHDSTSHVTGQVTLLTDQRKGLGVENMRLALTGINLDVARPYIDSIPLNGTLTGALNGEGFLAQLALDLDLNFVDAQVPGGAESHIAGIGTVHLGGPHGAVFDSMALHRTDIDLRTVTVLVPAVALHGHLALDGTLNGAWKDITFRGGGTHRDGDHPASHFDGLVRLNTLTDTVHFATDVQLDALEFDGLRPSYPSLAPRGDLRGPLKLSGTPSDMQVDADLHGALGNVKAKGGIHIDPARFGGDHLALDFSGVDLALVRGGGRHTALSGSALVDGSLDSLTGPSGSFELTLGPGPIGDFPVDSVMVRAHAAQQLVTVDTLEVAWPAGRAAGSGSIGWKAPHDGTLAMAFSADSLLAFDSLVTALAGLAPDTSLGSRHLEGNVLGTVELSGALDAPTIRVDADGRELAWRAFRVPRVAATLEWTGGKRPRIDVSVTADSVTAKGWSVLAAQAEARGFADSLDWSGVIGMNKGIAVAAAGQWWQKDSVPTLWVDSLQAKLPTHAWRLQQPTQITLGGDRFEFTPLLRLDASDGSGSIQIDGSLPRSGNGTLTVNGVGLDLRDVYLLLQRDSSGVAGTLQVDLAFGGTAAKPTIRGIVSVSDLALGDIASPYVQGVVDYADQRLEANLLLWKTGTPVLRVEAQLPLDLALKAVPKRQLPGPLSVRAFADSTDLGILEAFTRTVRRVRGSLRTEVEIAGTWDEPHLTGFIDIRNGQATVPGLGVKYTDLNLQAHLAGDSIEIDTMNVHSGDGELHVTGALILEKLTGPVLDLRFRADRFRAIEDRRFLILDASGNLTLTGPVWQATLTGRLTADAGSLQFADLITKRIVDLENPEDSTLIDLSLVQEQKLGSNFQNRFLDSLTIQNLRIQMGEAFWLRSTEANIQLDGDLTINKTRDRYRYDGTLNALRGKYQLRVGFVYRDFDVNRGTVRYVGTPDLNADLDIEATHKLTVAETGEDIDVTAHIGGTMLAPKLTLSSVERPQLTETELVSYLIFGRPSFAVNNGPAGTGNPAALEAGLSYLSGALSSEIQRTLITDLGVPLDYLDIRTGSATFSNSSVTGSSTQVAQVSAGWQLGRRWFVALTADLCTSGTNFYPNAEYRLSRPVRFKASVEPTYPCTLGQVDASQSRKRYQVGFDVLWDREY